MNVTRKIIWESLGKAELNQRGNPEKRTHHDDMETQDDYDKQDRFLKDQEWDSGFKNADDNKLRIWGIKSPQSESEFIKMSAMHVTAECHDVVNDSIFGVGHFMYVCPWGDIDENGRGNWDNSSPALFIPSIRSGTIELKKICYGSWYGGSDEFKFYGEDIEPILGDIYTFFPFLEKYDLVHPRKLIFKVGSDFIQKCEDACERNQYAWQWTQDLENAKMVKKEQIDQMWDVRKKHELNKDKEMGDMWKKHDKDEEMS